LRRVAKLKDARNPSLLRSSSNTRMNSQRFDGKVWQME
jgi:hypothetical protein